MTHEPDAPTAEPPDVEQERLEGLTLLAGELAHDVNNYLTGILGNASMVLRKLGRESTCHGMVRDIERAALHAAELSERMLTFAGRTELAWEPVDLSSLIRDMGRLIKLALPSEATLELALEDALPEFHADQGKLRDVALQLVVNAGDALSQGRGQVRVSTGVETLDPEDPGLVSTATGRHAGLYAFLEVTDDGSGMDAETQRRLCEPFFSRKASKGRGLGMAVVLGVVRSHGGAMRITSAPGEGTTLRVSFPIDDARDGAAPRPRLEAVPTPVATPADSEPLAGASILVVDDEEIVRTLAESILEDTGCTVLTAASGEEAVEIVEAGTAVDIVVLDVTMPGLGGIECFRQLRALRPELAIILQSGHCPDDIEEQLGTRPSGFVRKPYRPTDLIEALEAVATELSAGETSP